MAVKPVAKIVCTWLDAGGRVYSDYFCVEDKTSAGSLNMTTQLAEISPVIDELEGISESKFLNAVMVKSIAPTVSNVKSEPADHSCSRRHAVSTWRGVIGDNLQKEVVEMHVPHPGATYVSYSGVRDRLNTGHADVTQLIADVKSKGLTAGGDGIDDFITSFIRQRALTKRSKQGV